MKTRPTLAFMVLALFFQIVSAQEKNSEIHKNVNLRAKGLSHQLNTTKDSLLLDSDQLIYRVSFLYDGTRKILYDNNSKKINIPLLQLERGKYTVLVYQESRIVVFGVTKSNTDFISIASNLVPRKATYAHNTAMIKNTIDTSFNQLPNRLTKNVYANYKLSTKSTGNSQTRAEYRRTHLRPNGKAYDK